MPFFIVQIKANQDIAKPLVFINCGIHAREWVSPATCMCVIEQVRICFDYIVHYYICYFQAVRLIIHVFIKVSNICRYHKTIHANVLFGSKPRIALNQPMVRACDGADSKIILTQKFSLNTYALIFLCLFFFFFCCNQGPNKFKLTYHNGNTGLNIRIILPNHD